MMAWDLWKQGFDAWENATAEYLERLLKNESLLAPAGAMLTLAMRTKATTDRMLAAWWGAIGLSTKRDHERSLHKLNQIESRLLDLAEMLMERRAVDARAQGSASSQPRSPIANSGDSPPATR